jgi:membrane protein implicated in regulation of membrane protease activity
LVVVVSPVSRLAAILIILLGIFTLVFVPPLIVGILIIVLGVALYWLLYRFSARVERELSEVDGGSAAKRSSP